MLICLIPINITTTKNIPKKSESESMYLFTFNRLCVNAMYSSQAV